MPRRPLAFACLLVAATSLRADAPILFEETFLNTTGKNRNIDVPDYAWGSFTGPQGTLNRASTSISGGPGNPSDTPGFFALSLSPDKSRLVVKNLQPALNLAEAGLSFRFGASHMSIDLRVVVRVAGQWYASDTVFTPAESLANAAAFAAAPEPAVLKKFPFSRSASAWRSLALNPGADMTLSEKRLSAPLPDAPVSALGFLLLNYHGRWGASAYLDTVRIQAAAPR